MKTTQNKNVRQLKRIFYIFYFAFIGGTIIMAFFQEFLVNNLGLSFNQIIFTLLPIWGILGIVLMLAEWAIESYHIRRLRGIIRELEKSNTSLKAKLFDQEEKIKATDYQSNLPPEEDPFKKDHNQDRE